MAVRCDTYYMKNGRCRQYLEKMLLESRRQQHFREGCWVNVIELEQFLMKRAGFGPIETAEYKGHSGRRNSDYELIVTKQEEQLMSQCLVAHSESSWPNKGT